MAPESLFQLNWMTWAHLFISLDLRLLNLKVAVILADLRSAWRAEQHCNYWAAICPSGIQMTSACLKCQTSASEPGSGTHAPDQVAHAKHSVNAGGDCALLHTPSLSGGNQRKLEQTSATGTRSRLLLR